MANVVVGVGFSCRLGNCMARLVYILSPFVYDGTLEPFSSLSVVDDVSMTSELALCYYHGERSPTQELLMQQLRLLKDQIVGPG